MLGILLSLAALATPALAGPLDKADALFEKRLYQEALKEYETALKHPEPETSLRALYRGAECEALLFRYGEAAARLQAASPPADPLWKARFQILRAELAREYLKQYGRHAPQDIEETPATSRGSSGGMLDHGESPDLSRRSPREWHAEIRSAFARLWDLREALAAVPLLEQGYFVDLKNADLGQTPSLWDFAVLRWSGYLLEEAEEGEGKKPAFLSVAARDYAERFSPEAAPGAQAAALFEESRRSPGPGRRAAAELWGIRRLLLPFQHPGLFEPAADSSAARLSAVEILRSWLNDLSEPLARAQAGLEAARLHDAVSDWGEAAALCRQVEKAFPAARASRHCEALRARIELPILEMTASFAPPPGRKLLKIRARNLDKLHLRLYRVTPEDLLSVRPQYQPGDWSILRQADKDLLARYAERKPAHAWIAPVSPSIPHAYAEFDVDPPALTPGLYLAMASADERFKPGASLLSGVIVNVTELFLLTSAGPQGPERDFIFDPAAPRRREVPGFHFYTMNALTGEPQAARIDAFRRDQWGTEARRSYASNDGGLGQAPVTVLLAPGDYSHASLDPLARAGDSYAYPSHALNWGHSVAAPLLIFLETDRPIYRPGQEVRVKATALRRLPRGYKAYDGASTIEFRAADANGQEIFKTSLKPGPLGSASTRFTIPAGRLLGSYHAQASLSDFGRSFSEGTYFVVEEYKRPEFEVSVAEASGPWKYGRSAVVEGKVRYYFGGPVPEAPVSYRVSRQDYIPWFCWWWRGSSSGRVEVHSGQAKTDAEGRFSFAFVPAPGEPGAADRPSDFVVEVEARDPGGRTIQGRHSFRAGAKAYLFEIAPPAGFLVAGKPASIPIRLMNLNEQTLAGKGRYELYKLPDRPPDPEAAPLWDGYFGESPPLERLYEGVANGPKAAEDVLAFSAHKPAQAKLPALEAGVYRLTVKAEDPWGGESSQSVIVLSVPKLEGPLPLSLPAVAIPEHASYLPGETARLLVGSALLDGALYAEVWAGSYLLERRVLGRGGARLLSIPVGEDHKGGFTVRWFGAKDFRIRNGQVRVEVPWKDRELSVKLKHEAAVTPGRKVSWSLSVKDSAGKAVDGEAMLRVFDRSLEYYATSIPSWWVHSLYPARHASHAAQGSLYQPYPTHVQVEEGWIKKMLDLYSRAIEEPEPPALRLNHSRIYGYRRGVRKALAMASGAPFESDEAMSGIVPGAAPPEASLAGAASVAPPRKRDGSSPPAPPVATRKDFSETAFFEPHLKIAKGHGTVAFKAPEQLTSWKVEGHVLTQDVKRGALTSSFVTKKDLMVRVELPRFYREGDKGLVKAVAHNETADDLSGEILLSVEEDGKPAAARLGLRNLAKPFSAKPHGLAALAWEISAPRGQTSFKVRAVARAGALADAEERELPILPSRQRLIKTALLALDGAVKKTLKLAGFEEPDPTRIHESMHLQIDPQLALSILNSLPFLVHYPHECTEQVLNRYVPLAIVNSFYKKHPDLAKAARKIPRRDTLTPAWERADPRRLMRLMETPWQEVSQGRKSHWPLIDLFDEALARRELSDAVAKLKAAQNSDGAFPWFPGGRSDPYITLLVLAGLAEAQRYGVEIPREVAGRALAYVNQEIPKRLKPQPAEVSLILYAAYVVTSFPGSLQGAENAWRFAKAWADYADKHSEAMTPLGKAYAAMAYGRLGDKAKSESYLARAMDGAREDPVAGVYWTPEKLSWLWYNDSVETHAFLLRALLSLKPEDPRIPGMAQWLLFNRKGNEWKSTKASAAAIFSLLDLLKARGALADGERFRLGWGDWALTAAVEPFAWLEKPLRWSRSGAEIGPSHGEASIEKAGPGLAFASLTWIYSSEQPPKASGPGLIEIERRFFKRRKKGDAYHLAPLAPGDAVSVGDQVEVQLKVSARSQFEYLHLKDPKLAGFEAEELTSGWKWDRLSRYEEPRDSLTNFFMDWLPHGEYVLSYRLRPTVPGRYRVGAAVLQSMYAPEVSARSEGFSLEVGE